ncbi:organic cation/carnitine transporter 6 [Quercus suber]|uniref:Organic cation/carnitine transporter 6 n=1 Tax=Quercus suber TaxID=58331 RepID=A0AAW0LN70_QUESU
MLKIVPTKWLFMEGRDIEAKAVLRKLASIEGNSLDLDLSSIHLGQEISTSNPYKLMKDLFKRRWALRRILATMPTSSPTKAPPPPPHQMPPAPSLSLPLTASVHKTDTDPPKAVKLRCFLYDTVYCLRKNQRGFRIAEHQPPRAQSSESSAFTFDNGNSDDLKAKDYWIHW